MTYQQNYHINELEAREAYNLLHAKDSFDKFVAYIADDGAVAFEFHANILDVESVVATVTEDGIDYII